MDRIIVENEKIDPYFILGVSKEDKREIIELMYKLKAKLLHPDKSKLKNKELRDKNFRILQESFEYIKHTHNEFNDNRNSNLKQFDNERFKNSSFENANKNTKTKSNKDMNSFNDNFEKNKVKRPEDFGYSSNRLENLDEYNEFNYKPTDIFGGKHFDPSDFNKMFEYNKKTLNEDDDYNGKLVHKTTDGFYAYNSGGCENQVASISNYNGLMLVGDNLGESGVGYSSSNFGDFKQSFKSGASLKPTTITDIGSLFRKIIFF